MARSTASLRSSSMRPPPEVLALVKPECQFYCRRGSGGHSLGRHHASLEVKCAETTGAMSSPAAGGFLLDGKPVTLVRPAAPRQAGPARTASGSVAAPAGRGAQVARASRIYVEGRHDAELVEQIWGDDLRDVGVVVEYLEGIDHLPGIVAGFSPGPGRRLGVLVDHLVPGSKERRIAAEITSGHVLITGHPFIDIWQAVKPSAVGIAAWPEVPRGLPWKEGVVRALGWPDSTAAAWQRIRRSARSFADLEPALLGSVEHLIDFVTGPGSRESGRSVGQVADDRIG